MLKPQRKITRNEIKRDPLLDTLEKIESGFENNKKIVTNAGLLIIAFVVGTYIFYNNSKQNDLESNSAIGIAMIAYSNADYENAKFQFETVVSNFNGTNESNIAHYFLGKIAFKNNSYDDAKTYLNNYINSASDLVIACGAIKLLHSISFQGGNHAESLDILKKGNKFNLGLSSKLELQLLEAYTYIKLNDFTNARENIDDILQFKKIPSSVKQKADELNGMM
ncbi:tetratricopeptide repeat protein [Candidatus Marinimicrobia bacterium]|nr:tetratricopeptide repeat protein [Candidatus Neomarinimicrobiota bacterium]